LQTRDKWTVGRDKKPKIDFTEGYFFAPVRRFKVTDKLRLKKLPRLSTIYAQARNPVRYRVEIALIPIINLPKTARF